jgi:hypothetical protein
MILTVFCEALAEFGIRFGKGDFRRRGRRRQDVAGPVATSKLHAQIMHTVVHQI